MRVSVCVKRVPAPGDRIALTDDGLAIDTRFLGFTVSPHEECAVEEAVRLVEAHGGSSVVVTLGPPEAEEQLRDALAVGIERAVLLESDGSEWGPVATAEAIADVLRAEPEPSDVVLFGNESADVGGHQVPVRVAHALGFPVITGAKGLEVADGIAVVRRESPAGIEVFEVPLPLVVSVREGINLPRLASVPGRLRAKRKEVSRVPVTPRGDDRVRTRRLVLPPEQRSRTEILGTGPEAAPAVVDLLERLGVTAR
jgi:electron transfer flavoprotein beta subunit